jgi:hypothetical protein
LLVLAIGLPVETRHAREESIFCVSSNNRFPPANIQHEDALCQEFLKIFILLAVSLMQKLS